MPNKIKTETLPVNLTTDEKLDYAARAARAVDNIAQMQSEAKSTAADFKARIKDDTEEVAKLSRCIRTGIDYRPIEIREIVEHDKSHAAVYRQDTGKLVRTRPLTPDEMQTSLDDVWPDDDDVDNSIPSKTRALTVGADADDFNDDYAPNGSEGAADLSL